MIARITPEWVFAIGAGLLNLGLLPSLVGSIHTPAWSAALTASVLFAFSLAYRSLGMRWAYAMVGLQASFWTYILIQVI